MRNCLDSVAYAHIFWMLICPLVLLVSEELGLPLPLTAPRKKLKCALKRPFKPRAESGVPLCPLDVWRHERIRLLALIRGKQWASP